MRRQMIILRDISLRRGSRLLLSSASVTIQPQQRLALIGANGSGKSSLFALLLGELGADTGSIEGLDNLRLAHMAQEVDASDTLAGEYVLRGDRKLAALRDSIAEFEERGDFAATATLHSELETIDGYSAGRRVQRLLDGLGFDTNACHRAVSDFSGGWRIRLNLARALMAPSDLLLLDEPTNHLDLDATLWLQQWLQRYTGTLLIISHDRDFIDATCERVLHIEQGQLIPYKGNYSLFEQQRAERLLNQQAQHEKQQQRIAHIEDFVRRFRAKATKARQAQSRLKELERMQRVAPAHVDSVFSFTFPTAERSSDPLLRLDEARLGYPGRIVLSKVNLLLRPGSRYGLLGKNGAGKSTLLKSLVGELPLLEGEVQRGAHCHIGYFHQQTLEALDPAASAVLHLQRMSPDAREQELLDFLGGFNFRGDAATSSIQAFSGGEKARLALALVVWQKPNLLVLDEPTNHLDLDMRNAIEMALQHFEGAMILVSHDRHMLRNTCDELLLVHEGRIEEYSDDLAAYERWVLSSYSSSNDNNPGQQKESATNDNSSRRQQRQQAAATREQLRPIRQRISQIEKEMAEVECAITSLQTELSDPALYSDRQRVAQLSQQEGQLTTQLKALEADWLAQQEALEALVGEA